MDESLLDTDILSEVLKRKDQQVLVNATQYLAQHQWLAFSALTIYEIMRGMLANRATRQLNAFLNTLASSEILPVSMTVLQRAAHLWADAAMAVIRAVTQISSSRPPRWRSSECWSPETRAISRGSTACDWPIGVRLNRERPPCHIRSRNCCFAAKSITSLPCLSKATRRLVIPLHITSHHITSHHVTAI
jgi:predicted nucleic acid-binding protein